MRRSWGADPLGVVGARGYGCSRWGLIGGAPCVMGIWEFEVSISDGPWGIGPLGPDDGAVGIGATVGCGLQGFGPGDRALWVWAGGSCGCQS